jgi:hypothetical protein
MQDMDCEAFMSEVYEILHDFHLAPLNAELQLESVRAIELLHAQMPAAVKERDTIMSHGNEIYSINDSEPLKVLPTEDAVLTAFLTQSAMDKDELDRRSGYTDARKILKNLKVRYNGRFAPAISFPGSRGRGGYRVKIRKI